MWFRLPTTSSRSSRCWTSSNPCPQNWRGRNTAGGHGLFQRGECRGMREGRDRPADRHGRQPHHPPLQERFEAPPPAPENPTPVEAMAHRLKTPEGRDLYALRKQTPEPVFGIIKSCSIPSIFDARTRKSTWRVEPCDHGLEYETDVRPQPRLRRPYAVSRSPKWPGARSLRRSHNPFWTPSSVR